MCIYVHRCARVHMYACTGRLQVNPPCDIPRVDGAFSTAHHHKHVVHGDGAARQALVRVAEQLPLLD